ncbi:hypothetical protein G6L45_33545, partial [Agrobacterium rhizogenes]
MDTPLSFSQRRLWLLDQIDGPSSTYNIPWSMRLRGSLDVASLDAALTDVIRRHESLRTIVALLDGQPVQHILPALSVGSVLEVREIKADLLHEAVDTAVNYTFNLGKDLPLRVWLFHVGKEESVLVVLLHHIASDGWSFAPLAHDLETAYAARLQGREPDWA